MPLFYHMERFPAPHKLRMSLFFVVKSEVVPFFGSPPD